jgi:hypothetical protein
MVRYLGDPVSTGVAAIGDAEGFTTYPVPCEGGTLNVRLEGGAGSATLSLLDLHGRVLRRTALSLAAGTVTLDAAALADGTYLVELLTVSGRTVRTVVIAH